MKISLPLKLGISVVLLFAVVIATCLLWTPVRSRWYISKLGSSCIERRVQGIEGLLSMGKVGRELIVDNFNDGKEAARFLIKYWKEFDNAIAAYGRNPFHMAVMKGYGEVAAIFIARGADVNASGDDGDAPLHTAAKFGYSEIAELLIRNGADVNAKGQCDRTPLDVAMQNYNYRSARIIHSHGGKKTGNLPCWNFVPDFRLEDSVERQLETLKSKSKERKLMFELHTHRIDVDIRDNSFDAAVKHLSALIGREIRITKKARMKIHSEGRKVNLVLIGVPAIIPISLFADQAGLVWRVGGSAIILDAN